MISKEMVAICTRARQHGWVMEPEAKKLLSLAGLSVPRFVWAGNLDECLAAAREIGYPLVAKVVSPEVLHKSDSGGVVVGLRDDKALRQVYERFCQVSGFAGVLLEEMVAGVELIVGAKVDYQFGMVILLGMGGTGVEIYKDAVMKMAPLADQDIAAMVNGLKARRLLEGYRGAAPVNLEELAGLLHGFSALAMELEASIESIDLNPVFCNAEHCVIGDARIMLARENGENGDRSIFSLSADRDDAVPNGDQSSFRFPR